MCPSRPQRQHAPAPKEKERKIYEMTYGSKPDRVALVSPKSRVSVPFAFSAGIRAIYDRWLEYRTPPPHRLHGLRSEKCKAITIALGSLQRLVAMRAVSLSAIPAIIQAMNDYILQGVDKKLDPPNFPLPNHQLPYYSRQTTRKRTVRAFVVFHLLFNGWADGHTL
jgi:hypothetical protein